VAARVRPPGVFPKRGTEGRESGPQPFQAAAAGIASATTRVRRTNSSSRMVASVSLIRLAEGRFWMLETIREFALERLEETRRAASSVP